jgi:dihydrofolate reductase/thymidylate synthase
MKPFTIIYAHELNHGIGIENRLPWKIKAELNHFRQFTLHKIIIMGYNTYLSLGNPLPDRLHIVITSRKINEKDIICATSLENALLSATVIDKQAPIVVIGGSKLYDEAINHPLCESIVETIIEDKYICDTYFKWKVNDFVVNTKTNHTGYDEVKNKKVNFVVQRWFKCPNIEEFSYLNMLETILDNGEWRENRTGIRTLSLFGNQLRFNIKKHFPLLTTKSIPLRAVFEELMWFIRGDTNVDHLKEANVHIWDANTSRQVLDVMGKTNVEEGTLEYGYGFQWRHFGDTYINKHHQHAGFDQIQYILNELKINKTSRRLVLTAWNPANIQQSVLPPCHVMYIFNVNRENELSCMLVMRSSDAPLGLPFNIASTALLTMMIAHVSGLGVKEIVCSLADTHIYENQIEGVKELIKRTPRHFPRLKITRKVEEITEFKWEDFKLEHYYPHPKINIPMAV